MRRTLPALGSPSVVRILALTLGLALMLPAMASVQEDDLTGQAACLTGIVGDENNCRAALVGLCDQALDRGRRGGI